MVDFDGVSIAGADGEPLLRDLSFALAPGLFHLLTGPPGAGKTAILETICLARRPAGGRARVFGRDIANLSRGEVSSIRRRIGLMFAADRLLGHLTVFDNAALIPRVIGRRPGDYEPQVMEVLAWMGLAGKTDASPAALSAPERRRLALARAVANRPDMLLADEPTGGLEGEEAEQVLRLLAELNGAGTTVLMATADEALAAASGAPVLRLGEGRPVGQDGPAEAVSP